MERQVRGPDGEHGRSLVQRAGCVRGRADRARRHRVRTVQGAGLCPAAAGPGIGCHDRQRRPCAAGQRFPPGARVAAADGGLVAFRLRAGTRRRMDADDHELRRGSRHVPRLDPARRPGPLGARRQQSRFDPEQAHPGFTIGDTASGRLSVSVGAYNRATREIGRYSAAGPTRTTARERPGTSPTSVPRRGRAARRRRRGRFVGARSRRASAAPARLRRTSPEWSRCIFEYARFAKRKLGATAVLAGLSSSAPPNLVPNFHQQAARYPRIKQDALASLDVIGRGPVDFKASIDALFP